MNIKDITAEGLLYWHRVDGAAYVDIDADFGFFYYWVEDVEVGRMYRDGDVVINYSSTIDRCLIPVLFARACVHYKGATSEA